MVFINRTIRGNDFLAELIENRKKKLAMTLQKMCNQNLHSHGSVCASSRRIFVSNKLRMTAADPEFPRGGVKGHQAIIWLNFPEDYMEMTKI